VTPERLFQLTKHLDWICESRSVEAAGASIVGETKRSSHRSTLGSLELRRDVRDSWLRGSSTYERDETQISVTISQNSVVLFAAEEQLVHEVSSEERNESQFACHTFVAGDWLAPFAQLDVDVTALEARQAEDLLRRVGERKKSDQALQKVKDLLQHRERLGLCLGCGKPLVVWDKLVGQKTHSLPTCRREAENLVRCSGTVARRV
jgi:hypothetical protein